MDGPCVPFAVPKLWWTSNTYCPYDHKAITLLGFSKMHISLKVTLTDLYLIFYQQHCHN